MSDHLHSPDEQGLPRWVGALLRRPVHLGGDARARLMARVHGAPPPRRMHGGQAWPARRGFTSLAGIAAAAACMMLVVFGSARTPFGATDRAAEGSVAALLHDSLYISASWMAHDTLRPVSLRDTLRLVRFVLVAPGATRLALAGDFSGWRVRPMSSVGDSAGSWTATVLLRPGTHRYTILAGDSVAVRDSDFVADTAAAMWTVTLPVDRN